MWISSRLALQYHTHKLNVKIFFAEQLWEAFALRASRIFYGKNMAVFLAKKIMIENFNILLTNIISSFKQPAPEVLKFGIEVCYLIENENLRTSRSWY